MAGPVAQPIKMVGDVFALAVLTATVLLTVLLAAFFVNSIGLFSSRAGMYIRRN